MTPRPDIPFALCGAFFIGLAAANLLDGNYTAVALMLGLACAAFAFAHDLKGRT